MERQLRPDLHASPGPEIKVTPDSPRHQIDVALFRSPILQVGRFRCPAGHPHFHNSGPAAEHLFVFPRDGVWICHEGAPAFVADPNTVTYYNRGQRYTRRQLSDWGDRCDWFAVDAAALADTLAGCDESAADRPDDPFLFTHGPSDQHSYLRQRAVFAHVSREARPDRLFVEETALSVLGSVAALAYERHGLRPRRTALPRRDVEASEAARDVLARRFAEDLSLADIAAEVGLSVYHLARVFRQRTGFSLHAYRTQLRLRTALERLADPDCDLVDIALDLGFSSHSHFTAVFRRAFGETPSAVRASL